MASGVVVANLGAPAAKVGRPLDGLLRAKESVASYWRMPHFEAATNGTAWDAIVLMFGTNDLRAEPSDRNAALSSRSLAHCTNASYVAHLARSSGERELHAIAGKQGQPNGSPGWFKFVCVRFVRDYVALIKRVRRAQRPQAGTTRGAGRHRSQPDAWLNPSRFPKPGMVLLALPPHALFDAACGVDTHALLHLLPTLLRAVAIAADLPPPVDTRSSLGLLDHLQRPLACTRLSHEPVDHCRLWTCDRVHLSDEGYDVLARTIADEIAQRLATYSESS